MSLKEIGCDSVNSIPLPHNSDEWRGRANAVMNFLLDEMLAICGITGTPPGSL
jgi:hypothetical protein